ncbi:hypothetical protein PCANB_000150 [Pneumocystis canis]|nr:hypothetical protein PCANB_000150 [Pneumocystis canis]
MFQNEHFFSSHWETSPHEASTPLNEESSAFIALPNTVTAICPSPQSSVKEPIQLQCFCRDPQKEEMDAKDRHISYLIITQEISG